MIKLECIDCGQDFFCNGDKSCAKSKLDDLNCFCHKCSKKKGYSDKEFPYCYEGITKKEKVEFT